MWALPLRPFGVAVLALCVALGMTTPAQAEDRATAEALFQAGREAMDARDYKTACDRFEESHRLEPTAGALLNLANCRDKLGELATAWQRFQEAIEKLPAGDSRLAVAKERSKALEPRIPKLVLLMSGAPDGLTVLRDGVELGKGSLNLPLPVNPGVHQVIVRVPGRKDWQSSVELKESERRELALALGEPLPTTAPDASESRPSPVAEAPAAQPEKPADRSTGSGQRTLGFAIGGLGLAGLATSLITGAMVISRKSTVERECNGNLCTQAGLDAADSGKTLSTVSTIAFAVGAAGVGVGTYLILSASDEQRAYAPHLGIRTALDGAALELGGSF
jgi:hypothetical protein